MGRRSQPAGTQRTFNVMVRFRPSVKEAVEEKRQEMSRKAGKEVTVSELVRLAVWEFCKKPNDPRAP